MDKVNRDRIAKTEGAMEPKNEVSIETNLTEGSNIKEDFVKPEPTAGTATK